MSGPIISRVQIAAAHDGDAELIITLTFENGGQSLVTLDAFAVSILMKSCLVDKPDDLVGQGWRHVRDALEVSSNRFVNSNRNT